MEPKEIIAELREFVELSRGDVSIDGDGLNDFIEDEDGEYVDAYLLIDLLDRIEDEL